MPLQAIIEPRFVSICIYPCLNKGFFCEMHHNRTPWHIAQDGVQDGVAGLGWGWVGD